MNKKIVLFGIVVMLVLITLSIILFQNFIKKAFIESQKENLVNITVEDEFVNAILKHEYRLGLGKITVESKPFVGIKIITHRTKWSKNNINFSFEDVEPYRSGSFSAYWSKTLILSLLDDSSLESSKYPFLKCASFYGVQANSTGGYSFEEDRNGSNKTIKITKTVFPGYNIGTEDMVIFLGNLSHNFKDCNSTEIVKVEMRTKYIAKV